MKGLAQIGIALVTFVMIVTTATLFLYPYEPKQPPRAYDINWTNEGVKEIIDANNQFTFDLYSELSKSEKGNILYSPYSIFTAFAMVYEGAKGKTADEIKSVFHFPIYNVLRPNFAKIYNDINKDNKSYELRTGNALWIQQDYHLLEEYKNIVEKYYGGRAVNLNFVREPEKSRQIINSFIEEQTNHKIKDLIPPQFIDEWTRVILTNAIYFKGTWLWQFDPKETREMDFKVTPEKTIKVPMMYMKPENAVFNYADLEDVQILELPYKGEEISMLIILPKENLSTIEPLTLEKFMRWKSKMKKTNLIEIYIPKFEFETKYFLKETLKNLGISIAFTGNADFSGMSGKRDLFISFVIHQSYIKVDEEGSEAAAATAVGMKITSVRPLSIFKVDHPFIFIIQQKDSGNILFFGKVTNPVVF